MQQSRNIAARAGRWSAQHRKTAILGWISFVVLAFMAGRQARHRDAHQDRVGRRRVRPRREDRQRTPTPRSIDEMVLIQSKNLKTDDPEFRAVVADVTQRLEDDEGRRPRSHGPYGKDEQRGAISGRRPFRAGQLRDPGRRQGRRGRRPPWTRPSLATEAAQKAHPDFNVEQFGLGQLRGSRSRRSSTSDLAEGDVRLAADHADPPGHRVRHAGRGGHPAAAGDHRRRGHDGPRRPAQPALAGRGVDQPRDPAHRPGRRRGLRAVLPPPGARGARRRHGARKRRSRRPPRPRVAPCSSPASRS